jgi:hypothetical protein
MKLMCYNLRAILAFANLASFKNRILLQTNLSTTATLGSTGLTGLTVQTNLCYRPPPNNFQLSSIASVIPSFSILMVILTDQLRKRPHLTAFCESQGPLYTGLTVLIFKFQNFLSMGMANYIAHKYLLGSVPAFNLRHFYLKSLKCNDN